MRPAHLGLSDKSTKPWRFCPRHEAARARDVRGEAPAPTLRPRSFSARILDVEHSPNAILYMNAGPSRRIGPSSRAIASTLVHCNIGLYSLTIASRGPAIDSAGRDLSDERSRGLAERIDRRMPPAPMHPLETILARAADVSRGGAGARHLRRHGHERRHALLSPRRVEPPRRGRAKAAAPARRARGMRSCPCPRAGAKSSRRGSGARPSTRPENSNFPRPGATSGRTTAPRDLAALRELTRILRELATFEDAALRAAARPPGGETVEHEQALAVEGRAVVISRSRINVGPAGSGRRCSRRHRRRPRSVASSGAGCPRARARRARCVPHLGDLKTFPLPADSQTPFVLEPAN